MRGNIVMKVISRTKRQQKNPLWGLVSFWGYSVCHPDGYIEIKDRTKDIIISGGEHIPALK